MLFIRSTTSPSQKSRTFTNFFVFSLHEIAADLAIQATSKFLNDIRSTVGDDIFAKFLNLKTERSRAFVIDVLGSMSGEPHFAHLIKVNSVILRFSWKPLNQKSGKPRFYQQGQLKPIFKKKMQLLNFIHFFPYLIASFFYFISLFFCLFFFFLSLLFLIFHQMRLVRWKESPSSSFRIPWKRTQEHRSLTSLCLLATQVCSLTIWSITLSNKVRYPLFNFFVQAFCSLKVKDSPNQNDHH